MDFCIPLDQTDKEERQVLETVNAYLLLGSMVKVSRTLYIDRKTVRRRIRAYQFLMQRQLHSNAPPVRQGGIAPVQYALDLA